MKRSIALILSALLLCTSCRSAERKAQTGESRADSPVSTVEAASSGEAAVKRKVLSDWGSYAMSCEALYGDLLWAFSYLDSFLENPTWDHLQIARAAANAIGPRVAALEMPAGEMTLEDYDILAQAGCDAAWVYTRDENFQILHTAAQTWRTSLWSKLEGPSASIYLTYDMELLREWAALYERNYHLDIANFATLTDYLLLTLGDGDWAEPFNAWMEAYCPLISAERSYGALDADALVAQSNAQASEMEQISLELAGVVGKTRANADLFKDAIESGDIAALLKDAAYIDGLPPLLPFPDWWGAYDDSAGDNAVLSYIWKDAEGNNFFASPEGEPLSAAPDQYSIVWSGVSRDDFQNYLSILERYGYTPSETEGDAVRYSLKGGRFDLSWAGGEVSFLSPDHSAGFAPSWYLF